jgi:cell division protein FtsI (penicillin-binding protein 3)
MKNDETIPGQCIRMDGNVIEQFQPTVLDEGICKPQVTKAARQCMEAVVREGTGNQPFRIWLLPMAGKTGTAHVADGNININDGVYQATFVVIFRLKRPQFTVHSCYPNKASCLFALCGQLAAPVL